MDIFNSCSACHWPTATLTPVNSTFVHSVMCCIISLDCSGVSVCDRQWRDHAGGGSSRGPSGTGQGSSRGPPSLLLWAGEIQVSRCQSNPSDPWWSARTQGLPKVSHHNQAGTKNNGDKMFYSPIYSSEFPWVMRASRLPPAHWGGISKVFPGQLTYCWQCGPNSCYSCTEAIQPLTEGLWPVTAEAPPTGCHEGHKTHMDWLGRLPWTLEHPVEGIQYSRSSLPQPWC